MDIKKQLLDIVQDYIDFPASEIDPKVPLKKVAALDSFILIEMISSIEEKFGISISNSDVKEFKTLEDMILYLEKRLAE